MEICDIFVTTFDFKNKNIKNTKMLKNTSIYINLQNLHRNNLDPYLNELEYVIYQLNLCYIQIIKKK